MSKKLGYTLTEVLISILVIGVIVAVSVPMLRNAIPNKNISMIKKAYYVVDNIVKDLMNDTYYYPDMRSNCVTFGNNENSINPQYESTTNPAINCFLGFDYNQAVTIAGTTQTASGNWKFAQLFISKLETQNTLQDALAKLNETPPRNIVTTDGIVYNFDRMQYNAGATSYIIRIDINGKEGPNSYSPSYIVSSGVLFNQCASYDDWEPSEGGTYLSNVKFDRIAIQINYDGSIEIPFEQFEFASIINHQNVNANYNDF